MEKVNIKNLNIYKLDSIRVPHYESVIYHDDEFCYKIYNDFIMYFKISLPYVSAVNLR